MVSRLRMGLRRLRLLPRWVRRLDRRAARAINGRTTHPSVDRLWWLVSRSADRGVLWWTLGGVLALTGRGRPAARGLASLLVASIVANLVAKRVFGGERPLLDDVPIGRRLRRHPTTPAFPSGHSASAAAFALGAGIEWPRLGAALAPLALGVGYSRLHVGAHWLSDVAGGLTLGAAAAGLGALVAPPDRRARLAGGAEPAGAAGPDLALPASPDGEGVLIVVNPASGGGALRADPLRTLEARLPRARVHRLADDEDPAAVVRAAVLGAAPPRIVGVCGGDGTIAAVAQVAREAALPLLAVPGGTFNHFARAVGAPTADLAVDAIQRGEGTLVDVAELRLGDQAPVTVLNTASLGVHPDFVAVREQLESRLGRWPAALVSAARVLRRADPVSLELDGRPVEVWAFFVGVGRYETSGAAPLQRTRLDEGVLDVRLLRAGSRARAAASLVFGRGPRTTGRHRPSRRIETFTAERVEVSVRRRGGGVPGFAHDGEVALDEAAAADAAGPTIGYRASVAVVPAALEVYRPATAGAGRSPMP